MTIRLWPKDYERKDHISKAERALLRNAARNFKEGHFAVGIDPIGMSTASVKMGMYISPKEGLITFSLYPGELLRDNISAYKQYVELVEEKIYERLLDSKALIVRSGQHKTLKFPYKHVIMFPEEKIGKVSVDKGEIQSLKGFVTYSFFRPITSKGKERKISELEIFQSIRKHYDYTFKELSELECR